MAKMYTGYGQKRKMKEDQTGAPSSAPASKPSSSGPSSGGAPARSTYKTPAQRAQDRETISKPGGQLYYGNGDKAVHNNGKAWVPGRDYSADAEHYASLGDWDAVDDALMRRAEKRRDTGSTGGGRDEIDVWFDLNQKYKGPSAHLSLEEMRQGSRDVYGSGGKWGQGIYQREPGGEGGMDGPGGYGSDWDAALDGLVNDILGMSYEDFTRGREYANLSKRLSEQGRRVADDIIGQMSARTGGLASSYAGTVAAQHENDILGQLETIARQMYDADRGDMMENIGLVGQRADAEYGRYMDALNQSNLDRQFEYEKQLREEGMTRDDAMMKAELLAQFGDFSGYAALGFSPEEIQSLTSGYQQATAAKAARSSGGGSRRSSSSRKNSPQYRDVLSNAKKYKDKGEAMDYLDRMVSSGYITESERNDILEVHMGGSEVEIPTFSNTNDAKAFLKNQGVSSSKISGLMNAQDWARHKNSHLQTGAGREEVTAYDTYQDYLQAYVEYCLSTT